MATRTVAGLVVDTLARAGVGRIYGVSGDSLNGVTDSIRRGERLRWIHVRHEETAAFAAGAEAHLTGRLAVCAGSCGHRSTQPGLRQDGRGRRSRSEEHTSELQSRGHLVCRLLLD